MEHPIDTSTPASNAGSPTGPATISTSPPPMPPGSTRSRSGSSITQKAIRRGSFSSVTQLKEKILRFTDHYNPGARPFVWTATADSILHKIQRLCMAISGTQH